MKEKMNQTVRYFLPILFAVYAGLVISFTHVQIINGVIIVHSHVQWGDNESDPQDNPHSDSELILYNQLSAIFTIYLDTPAIDLKEPVRVVGVVPFFCDNLTALISELTPSNHLRAPPVSRSLIHSYLISDDPFIRMVLRALTVTSIASALVDLPFYG